MTNNTGSGNANAGPAPAGGGVSVQLGSVDVNSHYGADDLPKVAPSDGMGMSQTGNPGNNGVESPDDHAGNSGKPVAGTNASELGSSLKLVFQGNTLLVQGNDNAQGGHAGAGAAGAQNDISGLANFRDALSSGKVLVFNLDEMRAIDVATVSFAGGTTDEPAGLPGFGKALKEGKVLVFNFEDENVLASSSSIILEGQKLDDVAELPGFNESVEAGRVLVFNMKEMHCIKLCRN